MRSPALPSLLAAAVLLSSAACGDPAEPELRVSAAAPLPSVGADERPPPRTSVATGAPEVGLATFAATLPGREVIAPRPALPDPASRRRPQGAAAGVPSLTGRAAGGRGAVEFPLVHTRVVAQVSGNVARVEVTQYYANPSRERLEAVYAFPLPPDAAVTDMLFRVGSRVVLSEVKRREEAKRTYEEARAEGRTAALTEQERPNLFTQSVANVPPGDTVAVVLRYVHEVPLDDGRYLFHFPTTVGPRYVPGVPLAAAPSGGGTSPDTDRVPDGSRVTPPVAPPGKHAEHDVDVLVRLVPAAAFEDVVAKSHRIVTGVDGDGARLVALDEGDRAPDRDLVLSWRPAGAVPAAHAFVQREKGEDWLMLFVQPPAEVGPALVRPKELVFLIDKSGSMMGEPIERAKALVARSLDALGEDDTFQIVAFDGAAQAMTAAPVPGGAENVARAKAWLAALRGGGGTEMLAGIRAALTRPTDPRRLRMVVFCTDGFIGNEPEIVEAVLALRGEARVFGFGIGSSVNRYLVEGVARAGRGAAEVVDLAEPLEESVARLFKRLDRPVLTDLEVAFEGAAVLDLLPERLPDLFAGQPLVLAGRARGAPTHVLLRGRLGERRFEVRVAVTAAAVDPAAAGTAQPVVGTLWARRRIDALLSERPTAPSAAAVEEVVRLALRFKLVTPFTSFVAVERELRVDPTLPLAQVLVPNELPAGVAYEGIFGPASVEVRPARVKPGDPELRVAAGPTAAAVRVKLPFEPRPRDAVRDGRSGDFVLRFLVPPAWPDGSFDARVTIVHQGGRIEERSAPIRVDTTPAAIAVVAGPGAVAPGGALRLGLKPALPLARLASLPGTPGGAASALKGAMEVKEVLVRAPWGEVVRARMEGPLGVWVALLQVPADAPDGAVALEVAASDAAGNVSRRNVTVRVRAEPARRGLPAAYAGIGGTIALLGLLVAALVALVLARRRRPRGALGRVLLAGAVKRADER
jgi:Ca-activated chloride channel family protein